MQQNSPLGRHSLSPGHYAPDVLYPIARAIDRDALGLTHALLPFDGYDRWTAWELTWLGPSGVPRAACAHIRVPARSPNMVESKSLKLYLNSLAMMHYASAAHVERVITDDLSRCTGTSVEVRIDSPLQHDQRNAMPEGSVCLDGLGVTCNEWQVNPQFLSSDPGTVVTERLHSHVLRSLCPVTGQPDSGSVYIAYHGPRIDHAGLLQYIVSYRQHEAYHESCVERIFLHLLGYCGAEHLTVRASYQRRGGIDINPLRSNVESPDWLQER